MEEISDTLTGLSIGNLSSAIELIRAGQVPALSVGKDRPYDTQDFVQHLPKSFDALNYALKIVSENGDQVKGEGRALLVPLLLLLCGEHTDGSKPWTQGKHIQVSYKVLGGLKSTLNSSSVNKILLNDQKVLRGCINELRPKLDNFRDYPAAQTCFVWLLNHVQFPELSGHVAEFLPFSLRFVDDWESRNKSVGLGCLNHIVANVSQTELEFYGRSELITDVLCKNLVAHSDVDVELVANVCQTWFLLLRKTSAVKNDGKPNGWDLMAKQFLYKMEMASENDVKLCYSRLLPELIAGLKMSAVRWTKSTLRIMTHYVEQSIDFELKTNVMKSLHLILQTHLSSHHSSAVLEMLIRILYDVTKKSDNNCDVTNALEWCRKCLYKSAEMFPKELLHLCHGMNELKVNSKFDSTIENAFKRASDSQKNSETSVKLVMGTK